MTEEEMERYFQERHATQITTHRGEIDDDAYDDITQNGLLPSTKDPNLWIVKCRMGEEKNIAQKIMRKYLALFNSEDVSTSFFHIEIKIFFLVFIKSVFSHFKSSRSSLKKD